MCMLQAWGAWVTLMSAAGCTRGCWHPTQSLQQQPFCRCSVPDVGGLTGMSQGFAVLANANSLALSQSKACCQLQAAPFSLQGQQKATPLHTRFRAAVTGCFCHSAIAFTAPWLQKQQSCSIVWQSPACGCLLPSSSSPVPPALAPTQVSQHGSSAVLTLGSLWPGSCLPRQPSLDGCLCASSSSAAALHKPLHGAHSAPKHCHSGHWVPTTHCPAESGASGLLHNICWLWKLSDLVSECLHNGFRALLAIKLSSVQHRRVLK